MRRTTPALLCAALAALTLTPQGHASGALVRAAAPAPDRPPGIAVSSWVPVNNDFGAVIERPDRYAHDQPSALGYFVIRRKGQWLRLDSLPQVAPLRRPLRPASGRLSVGRNLAFVIQQELPEHPLRGQDRAASALGYFAIERGAHWLRLNPIAQHALFRGPLLKRSRPDWIPISDSLRFVIEHQMPQRYVARPGPAHMKSVLGCFMGKWRGRWVRLGPVA